jgi:single-stranded DNA-specific DHH superfamily exonuclease
MFVARFYNGYTNLSQDELNRAIHQLEVKKKLVEESDKFVFNKNAILFMSDQATEFTNEVTLIERGYQYYFVFTPNEHKLSVRIRKEGIDLSKTFDKMNREIVKDCGAHPYAGGIQLIPGYSQEQFENLINDIYNLSEEQLSVNETVSNT